MDIKKGANEGWATQPNLWIQSHKDSWYIQIMHKITHFWPK